MRRACSTVWVRRLHCWEDTPSQAQCFQCNGPAGPTPGRLRYKTKHSLRSLVWIRGQQSVRKAAKSEHQKTTQCSWCMISVVLRSKRIIQNKGCEGVCVCVCVCIGDDNYGAYWWVGDSWWWVCLYERLISSEQWWKDFTAELYITMKVSTLDLSSELKKKKRGQQTFTAVSSCREWCTQNIYYI